MSEQVVIAPMLVALVTAILTLAARARPRIQVTLSVLGGIGYVVAVARIALAVFPTEATLAYQLSSWPAPWGISLVADPLSAFMLAISAVVSIAALLFAVVYVEEFGQRVSFHPLYHFMFVGVAGAFLTGDIFNLFVWFEVMLMPSYVLVVFYSGPEHTKAALQYTVLNLIGSAVMLLSIGGLYATTGTLNMADMARRLATPAQFGIDPAPVLGLAALLFAVFALKAGIVPFQFWVPDAYRAAPAPVSAVLAGVTKKVGVYAIVRLLFTVFAAARIPGGLGIGLEGESFLAFFGPVLFVMATASIFLGGLGAVSREDVDELLAYSSIGQVGFIVLPLALAATVPDSTVATGSVDAIRTLGVAAALVYSLNHAIAKSTLFLVSGVIYEWLGSIRFEELGGLSEESPVLAGSFLIGGLALVGIPPLTGFFGKFLIFDTAGRALTVSTTPAGAANATLALAVALFGAVFTIAYVSRAWNRGFWGEPNDLVETARVPVGLVVIVALLASILVLAGIGFDPIYESAQAAAHAALDSGAYVDAVDPATEVPQ